jgi:hypothetical protein
MAYQTHYCSAAFLYSVCLIAFLHTSLVAICSSTLYALCTMSIHCIVPLLCYSAAALSSYFTRESPLPTTTIANSNRNNNPISSLYRVFIASVHLVHAMFAMPLHADSTPLSSTSRVICLIIIMTLHLLWWFTPRVQHHCMLY